MLELQTCKLVIYSVLWMVSFEMFGTLLYTVAYFFQISCMAYIRKNNSIPTLVYLNTLLLNFGLIFDIFWNFISRFLKNWQKYRIRGIYRSNNIVVNIVVYNLQRSAENDILHKKNQPLHLQSLLAFRYFL